MLRSYVPGSYQVHLPVYKIIFMWFFWSLYLLQITITDTDTINACSAEIAPGGPFLLEGKESHKCTHDNIGGLRMCIQKYAAIKDHPYELRVP